MCWPTIRLPPELRARINALAKQTGRSAHSLIVEAVERHAAYEEQMRILVEEALAADADIERTGVQSTEQLLSTLSAMSSAPGRC